VYRDEPAFLVLSTCYHSNLTLLLIPPNRNQTTTHQTIEDLESMLAYVKENNVQAAAVIGGGLLGLEAAKAVADMNVKSHIVEFAPILMCRQVS
jgi:NAD(P)H-nitrite reductase large subunit